MRSWRKLVAPAALVVPLSCSVDPVTFLPAPAAVCLDGVVDDGEACDDGNAVDGDGCDGNCTVTACGNGVVTAGEACDDGNADDADACLAGCVPARCGDGVTRAGVEACDDANEVAADGCEVSCTPSPIAYVKASNPGSADMFGYAIALSADGSTLAVGAHGEDSAATGIDGDQGSEGAQVSGAVYVFTRVGGAWRQQAYVKASNTGTSDAFGLAVALSADGSTLAVGAYGEDSTATGIGGDPANDGAPSAGAAYVFTRAGGIWSQQAYVKASNTGATDNFGISVALSADGSRLAVGAYGEDSAAPADPGNNAAESAGAAYVFARTGAAWSQEAYVKAAAPLANALFGYSVALSGDGATLAVGAYNEASAGVAHVFRRAGTAWAPEARLGAPAPGSGDLFGWRLALSDDGATLATTALYEDSAATGVGGDPANDAAPEAGAAYVFARAGTAWALQAYVKAINTEPGDYFGYALALSRDGGTLAVGAYGEDGGGTGTAADPARNDATYAGAVYRYRRAGAAWAPAGYLKASNTESGDYFGIAVALSGDGALLAASAYVEDSGAAGPGGDPSNNAAPSAGAVYVYQ